MSKFFRLDNTRQWGHSLGRKHRTKTWKRCEEIMLDTSGVSVFMPTLYTSVFLPEGQLFVSLCGLERHLDS